MGAEVVAASLEGGIVIIRAALARAGRQFDVWGALEVSPFTFMHSNQQRCEIDRTIFVMVEPNFQVSHIRSSGTSSAAAGDSGVPSGKSPATTQLEH